MIILSCKGGILALDYVKKYPEKVNSIIIIGTPYDIPQSSFQNTKYDISLHARLTI